MAISYGYSGGPAEVSSPAELRFGTPAKQNRATVFFRLIMVIPQIFVLYFVALAAFVVLVIGWFGALFTGRLPAFAVEFLGGFIRWNTRVLAYLFLITDQYPPFGLQPDSSYPVDLWVQSGKLNRLSVFFRFILVIPAALLAGFVYGGLGVVSIATWVGTLVKGEPPRALFDATAAVIRYYTRYTCFAYMLTSVYPAALYGDPDTGGPAFGAAFSSPPVAPGEPMPYAPTAGVAAPVAPAPGQPYAPPADPADPADPAAPVAPVAPVAPAVTPGAPLPPPTAPPYPGAAPAPAYGAPAYGAPAYGAPPYGAPPYGAPPVGMAPPAGGPSGWRLPVSKGGRTAVTVMLVLGIIGYVAYIPIVAGISHSNLDSIAAANSASAAYGTLSDGATTYESSIKTCTTGSAASSVNQEVLCFEAADTAFAQSLTSYATQLGNISYPSSATTQATAAEQAATHAASVLSSMAAIGANPDAYNSAQESPTFQSSLNAVDSTYNSLIAALGG